MQKSGMALLLACAAAASVCLPSVARADLEFVPVEAGAAKMPLAQARVTVTNSLKYCKHWRAYPPGLRVDIGPDMLKLSDATDGGNLAVFRYKDFQPPIRVDKYFLEDRGDMKIAFSEVAIANGKARPFQMTCPFRIEFVQSLADALLRLQQEFSKANDPATLERFKEDAARYRAMDPKPELPEAARRLRVQAESAVNAKRFADAADKYAEALALAPWWPEGHFNRGVVLGEMQQFDSAANEMKRYLMLRPDAPDARQAQDFIYAWEDYPYENK